MTREQAECLATFDRNYYARKLRGEWCVWCAASDHVVTFDNARIAYVIDYYDHDGSLGDCYPDFVATRGEAEEIAPQFMAAPGMEWAARFEIRMINLDAD
jgi:hypothetical protein